MAAGRLFLLPAWLAEDTDPAAVVPAPVLERIRALDVFVVEDAKSARRFLAACGHPRPMREIVMAELLGVATEDCVFVGDGAYRELQGAEAAGMTPVMIKVPHDQWEHEGTIDWAGPRVSSLSEVLALV